MKLVKFTTGKTTMYINTDHVVTVATLDKPLTDNGEDPCSHGITMINGIKFGIPDECAQNILQILGWVN